MKDFNVFTQTTMWICSFSMESLDYGACILQRLKPNNNFALVSFFKNLLIFAIFVTFVGLNESSGEFQ